MKHIHLIAFFITLNTCCFAQSWCPQGAQWHYSWTWFCNRGYVEYTWAADTVVSGKMCSNIKQENYRATCTGPSSFSFDTVQQDLIYTYASNDTVYFYLKAFGQWLPVYYFNALAGDTLKIPNSLFPSMADSILTAVVDSAGLMPVDTHQLRYYVFRILDTCSQGTYAWTGKVVEKIGILNNNLIPGWSCLTDNTEYTFCNYLDANFAIYPSISVCATLPTTIPELPVPEFDFQLVPNPSNNFISIHIPANFSGSVAVISDVMGKEVATLNLNSEQTLYDTTILPNGIYFVRVTKGSGNFNTKTLMVSK